MATPSELTGIRIGISMPLARISTISEAVGTADEEAMDEEAMEKERAQYERSPRKANSDLKIANPKT